MTIQKDEGHALRRSLGKERINLGRGAGLSTGSTDSFSPAKKRERAWGHEPRRRSATVVKSLGDARPVYSLVRACESEGSR